MANATVNLRLTKSGYVNSVTPYTVIPTDANTLYEVVNTGAHCLYFGMESMPNNLRHNALVMAYITVAVKGYGYLHIDPCLSDFDPETLTFNNRPSLSGTTGFSFSSISQESLTNKGSNIITQAAQVRSLFETRTFAAYGSSSASRYPSMKIVLVDGTSLPYATITYDDATLIPSKISLVKALPASINGGIAQEVTWKYIKDTSSISGYCADETWIQSSATFYWRNKDTEQTFHSIPISGTTTGVTIPAGTFPSGSQVEWYVEGTDEDGTTTETDKRSIVVLATQITPTNAPTSGYANPRNPISFSWVYQTSAGTAAAGDTSLFWRVSGSDSWTEVQAAHGANSVTIPANTFPVASTIQWYLSGTDGSGYASQSSQYSFSTAAGLITATPINPKNSVERNNSEITFTWSYSSASGSTPTRYKLVWKRVTDDSWTELVDSTTIVTTYTAPAYTFPAGELLWGVIPYNIDGVYGTVSSVSFICYGAPESPTVYATETPFTKVSWQADDQQAYEIKVGDTLYGSYFGTEKEFYVPDYLEDGEYTVQVRVVGSYGLWSEWGSTIINVQNVPGDEIVLGGVGGIDAFLSWVTAEETADFLVFRDGVQIGHTDGYEFTDRFSVGEHEYFVVNRLTDGNYTKSNTVTLEVEIENACIALFSGGEWVSIIYTLKDASDPAYDESQISIYNHLSGDRYPTVILTEYAEMQLSYSAVFLYNQGEEHEKFKALFGKPVVLKLKDGMVFVGVLDAWNKQVRKHYYTAYSFTLSRIEWSDYIDTAN